MKLLAIKAAYRAMLPYFQGSWRTDNDTLVWRSRIYSFEPGAANVGVNDITTLEGYYWAHLRYPIGVAMAPVFVDRESSG